MSTLRIIRTFAFVLSLSVASGAVAAPKIDNVEITSARLRVGDIVKDAPAEMATLDLGPAPAPAASRVLTRAELTRLLRDAGYTGKVTLADTVRITRKMKRLGQADIEAAFKRAPLPKGTSLVSVQSTRNIDVPDGFERVALDVGKLPRRAGSHRVTARASFMRGDETLATVPIAVELSISAEGARPDVSRGNTLTLHVRRAGIEVSVMAVAGADADVGQELPVTVRETGRVVKARLTEPARALLVESP